MKNLLMAFIFIGLFLFGCSGTTSQADIQPKQTAYVCPDGTHVLDEAECQSHQAPPASVPPAAETDASEDFKSFIAYSPNEEYKVDYRTTTVLDGEVKKESTSTMVIKGKNRRIDFDSELGQTTSTYTLEDGSYYLCTLTTKYSCNFLGKPPGADEGHEGLGYNYAGSLVRPLMVVLDPSSYTITRTPSRTIAGISATCFKYFLSANPELGGDYEVCFSSENILLYRYAHYGGDPSEETMIATFVQMGNISDSEFDLPEGAKK